jgi:hypothetical protein
MQAVFWTTTRLPCVAWIWLWLLVSGLVHARPLESRNLVASTVSSSTDQPVLTPRLLDRYYQDEDLVIVEKSPTSPGWFHGLSSTVTNSVMPSTGAELYQKMAPHVATLVGVGAWLRLAYRRSSRRPRPKSAAAPANATVPTTILTSSSSSSSSSNDHEDTKITRAEAESMVQAVQAQWQERYHKLEMEQDAFQQQRSDALTQLAVTVQKHKDSQLELAQLQVTHNATLAQLSVVQRQCADHDQRAALAHEQKQALAMQLAAVQEQLDNTRQELDTMQQERDEALAQRDEQLVQVTSLNNAVLAAHEREAQWQSTAQAKAQELPEYQQQAQRRHVGELRRFSESVLAIVDTEQSEFMAEMQAQLARLRLLDNLADAAPAI